MDFNNLAAYVAAFNVDDLDIDKENRFIPNSQALNWMQENIPLVDIPDKVIERAYYFRWWTFRKHIRKTPDGFVISEFLADVPWAGKHNTISCAAGHHFNEGRWIKNPIYLDQYLKFWFEGGGDIRSYSFNVAYAAYQRYLINGDTAQLKRYFTNFISNYEAWESERGDDSGLFWQIDDREGMELSMGGTGLRPNINSYMYAEAKAISAIADILGDKQAAKLYEDKAVNIQKLIKDILWDANTSFFKTFVAEKHRQIQKERYQNEKGGNDNAYLNQPLGLCPVPEIYGYTPWYYGVMDDEPNEEYLKAWRFIMDPDFFAGPVGLATAPISHPNFMRPHHHECAWDGPSWPFATCQALGAMAHMLRDADSNSKTPPVSAADFMKLMTQYAAAHRLKTPDGEVDWIDENYNPLTFAGDWIARERLYEWNDPNKDRGQYYNHSSFCDLIISDVIGLRCVDDGQIAVKPMAKDWPYFMLKGVCIRGRDITVIYDKDGSRYGKGSGLMVLRDGDAQ